MVRIVGHRLGALWKPTRRARGASLLTAGLAVGVLSGCAATTGLPYEGDDDARAASACEQLAGGSHVPKLLGATDATVEDARRISASNGLDPDTDTNLVGLDDRDYLALCLEEVDGSIYLYYQFEDEARSGAIGKYER